ncbi:MAG: Rid family detoxifying hydrolase [Acholeplasmataceae bacterium]|nr:Rid family detoxifying hydrolase [Acholeplasmataceae bacterium]
MTRRENIIQFLKFTGFSISAGVIEFGSFALINELGNLPYWPVYLTAVTLSVLWNFTLNRKFTFQLANNIPIAMTKVFVFYLFFIPITTYSGDAIVSAGVNEYIVLAVTMVLNFITEFIYAKSFVYIKMKQISTENAPAAIGPYAQAIVIKQTLYSSGQLGIDPQTNDFASKEIIGQTIQVFKNIQAILDASKFLKVDVCKVNVYLKDLSHFNEVNKLYSDFFENHKPARSTVEVSRLPKDGLIEIDLVAQKT